MSDLIAPSFRPVHLAIKNKTHNSFWLRGGRGSTKSSFIALEIIAGIIRDPDANGIVFRKVGDTIKDSVLANLEWAIEKYGYEDFFTVTVSPARIIYKPTGQRIIFKGLDNPLKIKSIKLKRGYFKYSWYEEAAEFSGPSELRSVGQSVKRGGPSFIEFLSYNPPIDPQAWINAEFEIEKSGKYQHSSTYLDVPRDWLGEEFIQDAEWLRENNPLAYEHEYMGVATGIQEAIIFSGKYKITDFEPDPKWDGPYFGADWGFANDPSTLVKCWVEVLDNSVPVNRSPKNLYIEYAEFGDKIELDDYPAFYRKVPGSDRYRINADNSRPETISHVKSKGYNIAAAEKWPGSVEDGITVLKSFNNIFIHTRCKRMQEEARLYSHKIDRLTKQITPDIVDKYNHGWDAVRYSLDKYIRRRSSIFN